MTKKVLIFSVIITLIYLVFKTDPLNSKHITTSINKGSREVASFKNITSQLSPATVLNENISEENILPLNSDNNQVSAKSFQNRDLINKNDKFIPLKFVIEDGLAVTQGDIIVGELLDQNADSENTEDSYVILPHVRLWPTSKIPFHIETGLSNSERVLQAISLFEGTAIEFIPYSDQRDAIVFTNGTENCKSYVGYTGGLQPILLSANCKPDEIAHEILHALGFIHEQNRSDRDNFINVLSENIEVNKIENFEKLPDEYMIVSGLSSFDFESLMIYPDWMFAKNGNPTMHAKAGQRIIPGKGLSTLDRERLNLAYKSR